MRRILYASALVIMIVVPASAKDATITLNDDEQKALMQVLDLATRQGGLQVARTVTYFQNKIEQASAHPPANGGQPNEPPSAPPKK